MGNKINAEQQSALNEFARCIYEGYLVDKDKKAAGKTEAFKIVSVANKAELDDGVAVKFTSLGKTVRGTLRARYSHSWEFIEG